MSAAASQGGTGGPSSPFGGVPATAHQNGHLADPTHKAPKSKASDFTNYRVRFHPPGYDPAKSKRSTPRQFGLADVPTFFPTREEFENPLDYIAKIRMVGTRYGAVKIVPPRNWKPDFSLPVEKFRFATRLQRLNHMNGRTRAAVSYLDALGTFHSQTGKQNNKLPNVNGRTVDMWKLKCAVESSGGYDEVCYNKEWLSMAKAIDVGEFPASNAQSIAYAVKKAYEQWILPYEASLGRGRTLDQFGRPTVMRQTSGESPADSPGGRKSKTSRRSLEVDGKGEVQPESPATPIKKSASSADLVDNRERGPSDSGVAEISSKRKREDGGDVDEEMEEGDTKGEGKRRKVGTPDTAAGTPPPSLIPDGVDAKNLCQVCFKEVVVPGPPIVKCDGCELPYHVGCLLVRPHRSIEEWWCPKCLDLSGEDFGFDEGGTYNLWDFRDKCEKWKRAYFGLKEPQRMFEAGIWTEGASEGAKGRKGVTEEEVEAEFWNLVEDPYNGIEVEYGADLHTSVHGSGFAKCDPPHPFHLTHLPFQHPSLFPHLSRQIPGMMVPWIYVGSAFSTFCWHVEDHWSYAVNYNWLGETKTWYIIPERGADEFEKVIKETVPDLFEKTPDLLFHITTMLSPGLLKEKGVPVFAIDQRPGEFVVTWPRAYHAGFNHGFNIAEAVNFATPDWMEMGEKCVERYREGKRAPVFSHDEMVMRVALGLKGVGKDGKTMHMQEEAPIDAKTIEWLLPALTALHRRELDARARLRKAYPKLETARLDFSFLLSAAAAGAHARGESSSSSTSGELVLVPGGTRAFRPDDDEVECAECKAYCYLSAVRCGNDACEKKWEEDDEDDGALAGKMGKMGPVSKTGSTKKKAAPARVEGGTKKEKDNKDAVAAGIRIEVSGDAMDFKQDVRYGFDYSRGQRNLRYVCMDCVGKLCPCTPLRPVLCERYTDEELTKLLDKYRKIDQC